MNTMILQLLTPYTDPEHPKTTLHNIILVQKTCIKTIKTNRQQKQTSGLKL